MRWLLDQGRKTHFGCCLLPGGGGGGVLGGGLRFKVIVPNLDTEATLVALLFILFFFCFCSSRQNDCQGVLENETKAKAVAVSGNFTSATGDNELLLIKNQRGGHTMHSTSFMLA